VFYGHSWKNFDEESKEDLCSITFPIRYKKRQLICMEANPVQNIYIVKKGLVKTYKSLPGGKQQILSIIKKEDILNIHCLFEDFGHHSSETLVDSELCAIDKNLLENLLKRKPKTGIIFLEIMKKKLVRSYQKIMELGQKNARSRIASFILDLSENLFDEQRHDFSLPLSRVEFAEVVGLCEETAIRILQDFKRESLINIDKNSISLLNPARLKRFPKNSN
jgi:cAMP-binding proteins - catabolite gene activator and regulatory subunit of cAMP-dependent protein kinases